MTRGALLGHGFTAEPNRKPAAFWRRAAVGGAFAAAFLYALAIGPTIAAGVPPASRDEAAARMLALVNETRATAGQAALAIEPRLTAAACAQARDLARGGALSHRGSDGSDLAERLARTGYPYSLAAENLAAGAPTPEQTVALWSDSPGHRRNMLTAEFREAGVARVMGAAGQIWVLVLGAPRPDAAPDRKDSRDLAGDKALTCY